MTYGERDRERDATFSLGKDIREIQKNEETRKFCTEKTHECAAWIRENGLTDCGGATVSQFCEAMDIDRATYFRWLKKEEFHTAIDDAREAYKAKAEKVLVETLMRAATGYDVEETKTEYQRGADGKPVLTRMTKATRHVGPNVGAAIFLLTNVAPDRWQNKQRAEMDVKQEASMTREEIEKELARLRALDD